jgi:ketol-acid reductoisomerase
MGRRFYDQDANPAILHGRNIAMIGYGNQGRAQAMNLRDSGLHLVVGNVDDDYRRRAVDDGFETRDIAEAVRGADIVFLLLPDEVQRSVYSVSVEVNLKPGATLVFAHGYNIHFGLIKPSPLVDVVLVAPKMIGEGVRELYQQKRGYPTLIAVGQDASGRALETTVALANALGGTAKGAWLSSFEEETVTDLFGEQVVGASLAGTLMSGFDTLVRAGYDPEVVQLELYGSGEMVEVLRAVHRYGLVKSLALHSRTSQYGQLSRIERLMPESRERILEQVLAEIRSGRFAREWALVEEDGYREVDRLSAQHGGHPMLKAEDAVRRAMAEKKDDAP